MGVASVHLTIHGRVQGIGYRAWLVRKARKAGLTGWVRNSPEGTVEALLCGDEAVVREIRKECEHGPLTANVIRVDSNGWEGEVPTDFTQLATV